MPHMRDHELPSLTVAVPARNEDAALEACLASVLASDYPKLEVIVYDDCSQDATPSVIRSYAHDGVRFILGEDARPGWLAKNQAYARLAENASGELILFCGVDVRFDSGTLRQLVAMLLRKRRTMLSVLPVNHQPERLPIVQSMRYYWELVPLRRLFRRPPVLSTCWLIRAQTLRDLGGFAAVAHSVIPEAYFARETIKHEGYSFVRSNISLGLTSIKTTSEQTETALRTRYPQLHRRVEMVCLVALLQLLLLVGPFAIAIVGLWLRVGLVLILLPGVAAIVHIVLYTCLVRTMFARGRLLALVAFPAAILYDIALLHYSMWKYEFSEIIWKGRNICLPVMRAYAHLPRL